MRKLRDALADTLLFAAKPSLAVEPLAVGESFAPLDLKSVNDARTETALSGKSAFDPAVPGPWSFSASLQDDGPRISNLETLAPCAGMPAMTARVCDEISWSGVSVKLGDRTIQLPLTPRFLLAHAALREEGKLVAGANRFYALEAAFNFGIQLVFAYELRKGEVVPLTQAARESGDFTDFVDAPAPGAGTARLQLSPGGATLAVRALLPRFLVCVSFTAHKPRNDFEPQGILLAGRMVPALFVRANCDLDEVRATVRVVRPATTSMAGMMKDVDADMGSVFFTDRNNAGAAPMWSEIFDYYLLPNSPGFEGNAAAAEPFTAVHAIRGGDATFASLRRLDKHRRTFSGAMPSVHLGGPEKIDGVSAKYPDTEIVKTAGQGEFDSVHIAPKMIVSDGGLKGTKVAMAPICAHDCLHTHWRWSHAYGHAAHTRGYDGSGASYRKEGAPLVPQNQEVRIAPVGTSGFEYSAVCAGPIAAREWQAILTHGSAYSLAVMSDGWMHRGLLEPIELIGFPWTYEILRYAPKHMSAVVPSLSAAVAAETAMRMGKPLLAAAIIIADRKAALAPKDFAERVQFSAADLDAMRKL